MERESQERLRAATEQVVEKAKELKDGMFLEIDWKGNGLCMKLKGVPSLRGLDISHSTKDNITYV